MSGIIAGAIITSAATLAYQSNQQEIVNRRAKEAANKQQAMQEIEAGKARQAAVREARSKRAQIASQGQAAGVEGSSGLGGAMSSLNSQLGSNLAFQNTQTMFSQDMANIQSDIFDAQNNIAMGGAIGGLVTSSLGAYGSLKTNKPTGSVKKEN